MTTEVLGALSFLQAPTVNGQELLINAGGVPAFFADITANRPSAGSGPVGRVFLDITLNKFYRDTGSSWVDLTPVSTINGTVNEVAVTPGTNVTPAIIGLAENPVVPGNQGMRIPVGTTANRPSSASSGTVRYNTTIGAPEHFNGTSWSPNGKVLQLVTGTIPAGSGSTRINLNSSLPAISEGTEVVGVLFTPVSPSSKIIISFSATSSQSSSARTNIFSVYANTTCIGAAATTGSAANAPYPISVNLVHQPGSVSTIDFSFRFGTNASGTWYLNSAGSTNTLGGAFVSQFTITEIQ